MKIFKMSVLAVAALFATSCFFACSDACDYTDTNTDNPSWVDGYNDSTAVAHPDSLSGSSWLRGTGMKKDVYGNEVQGFVESVQFVSSDSCAVKMSQGSTEGTYTDESNTEATPYYEYTYSNITGKVEIKKQVKDEKGNVSKSTIFTGIAVGGDRNILTLCHFGDTPTQTYLIKQ